jgi:hypothetical protein
MSLDITLSQMQKTLVFLAIQQKNAKDTYFQDIVTHLERNKSQVSTLLGTLENAYLIEQSNTRPQRITLTPEGIKTMQTQIITPFVHYLSQFNNHNNKKLPSEAQTDTTKILKKSEIIEFILGKVKLPIQNFVILLD